MKILTNRIKVGRYVCDLTYSPAPEEKLVAEWSPNVPKQLTPDEFEQYRAGRDAFMVELAKIRGETTVVVET